MESPAALQDTTINLCHFLQKSNLGSSVCWETRTIVINTWQFLERLFEYAEEQRIWDLLRLFSSSGQSHRVYLSWFVWDLAGTLARMKASTRSVKDQQCSGPIGSCLSTGFHVYLFTTSLRAGIQICLF